MTVVNGFLKNDSVKYGFLQYVYMYMYMHVLF